MYTVLKQNRIDNTIILDDLIFEVLINDTVIQN